MALRWFLVAVTIVTVVGIVAIGGITITSIAGSPFLLTPLLAEVSLVFLPATTVVDAFLIIAVMHMMIIDTHRRGVRASSLLWSAVVTSRTGRTRCRRGFGAVRNRLVNRLSRRTDRASGDGGSWGSWECLESRGCRETCGGRRAGARDQASRVFMAVPRLPANRISRPSRHLAAWRRVSWRVRDMTAPDTIAKAATSPSW